MNSGYDRFFQEARKANGREGSVKTRPAKAGGKPEFKIKERQNGPQNGPTTTAEERLKLAAMQRVARRKTNARTRRQKKMPVFAVACVTALLGFGVYSYQEPGLYDSLAKRFDHLTQHFEFSAFGFAEAADGEAASGKTAIKERLQTPKDGEAEKATATDKKSGAKSEKSADGGKDSSAKTAGKEGSEKVDGIANIKNWTPEELSFFNKLSDRKIELDRRETELNKLDEELQKQKAELDEKIKQLEKMRADIGQTLKARVTTDQEKIEKLVQVYSNMKPQNAAKVIETLNETLAVEVLDKMKKKNAAEILNVMETKKAQRLSEILAGYKGPET